MSRVLLVGAFGQGNPGDEALCAAFCTVLGDHDLLVASRDPDSTRALHGVDAIPATAPATAAALRRVDAVVVGGGTVFKTLHRSTGRPRVALLRNAAGLIAGAHAQGVKVAMIGVGAGDLHGRASRALTRWIVPRLDLLVVRDEESAAVLADVGAGSPLWIGADPAWTLGATHHSSTGDRRSITVAVSHLAGDEQLLDNLAAALVPYRAEYAVNLQPWQTGANRLDLEVARSLQARLADPATIVDAPLDLDDASARFGHDALVVGLRFHALVAAGRVGTRFVAVAHEPKLAGLARRLGQVSVPAHATAAVIEAAIEHGLDQVPPPPSSVQREVRGSTQSMELLRLMLDGGVTDAPHEVPALPLSTGSGTW